MQGQTEAKEAIRERGRQKLEEDTAKEEEYRGLLEDLYGQVLAVQEEVDMAKCEGYNVTKAKGQIDRAEACTRKHKLHLTKKNTPW